VKSNSTVANLPVVVLAEALESVGERSSGGKDRSRSVAVIRIVNCSTARRTDCIPHLVLDAIERLGGVRSRRPMGERADRSQSRSERAGWLPAGRGRSLVSGPGGLPRALPSVVSSCRGGPCWIRSGMIAARRAAGHSRGDRGPREGLRVVRIRWPTVGSRFSVHRCACKRGVSPKSSAGVGACLPGRNPRVASPGRS
jgi:hypothetical protein